MFSVIDGERNLALTFRYRIASSNKVKILYQV